MTETGRDKSICAVTVHIFVTARFAKDDDTEDS